MNKIVRIKGVRYKAWRMESIEELKAEYREWEQGSVYWISGGRIITTDKGNKIKAFFCIEEELVYYALAN